MPKPTPILRTPKPKKPMSAAQLAQRRNNNRNRHAEAVARRLAEAMRAAGTADAPAVTLPDSPADVTPTPSPAAPASSCQAPGVVDSDLGEGFPDLIGQVEARARELAGESAGLEADATPPGGSPGESGLEADATPPGATAEVVDDEERSEPARPVDEESFRLLADVHAWLVGLVGGGPPVDGEEREVYRQAWVLQARQAGWGRAPGWFILSAQTAGSVLRRMKPWIDKVRAARVARLEEEARGRAEQPDGPAREPGSRVADDPGERRTSHRQDVDDASARGGALAVKAPWLQDAGR